MELTECLPEIFCIKEGESYKVFENTVEKDISYVNVLTPANISPSTLVLSETPHQKIKTTVECLI